MPVRIGHISRVTLDNFKDTHAPLHSHPPPHPEGISKASGQVAKTGDEVGNRHTALVLSFSVPAVTKCQSYSLGNDLVVRQRLFRPALYRRMKCNHLVPITMDHRY